MIRNTINLQRSNKEERSTGVGLIFNELPLPEKGSGKWVWEEFILRNICFP